MNPETIYSNFRDEALATILSANNYSTFVAMPLQDRFSYHPSHILQRVLNFAATRIQKSALLRWFLLATIWGRYSGSAETRLDKDLKALEEKNPSLLKNQFVPLDHKMWAIDRFESFLEERRKLLAQGINQYIESLGGCALISIVRSGSDGQIKSAI